MMACDSLTTKTIVLVSTIYAIIQSIVHVIIQIILLGEYVCWTNLWRSSYLKFTYLFNIECFSGVRGLEIFTTSVVDRTIAFIAVYLVLDILWIGVSLMLAIIVRKNDGEQPAWARILWITVASALIILDITSTIIYGTEIDDTSSITNIMKFMTVGSTRLIYYQLKSELTSVDYSPAAVMLAISCRLAIFFIGNIIALIGMIIVTKRYKDEGPIRKKIPLKPSKPVIKPSKPSQLPEEQKERVDDWYKYYENNRQEEEQQQQPNTGNGVKNRRDPPEDDFDSNSQVSSGEESDDNRAKVDPNHKTPKTGIVGSNTNVLVNGVPSGTLRRQLPWSYFQEPDSFVQKQANSKGIDRPAVPVPDYTLRIKSSIPRVRSDAPSVASSSTPRRYSNSSQPSYAAPVAYTQSSGYNRPQMGNNQPVAYAPSPYQRQPQVGYPTSPSYPQQPMGYPTSPSQPQQPMRYPTSPSQPQQPMRYNAPSHPQQPMGYNAPSHPQQPMGYTRPTQFQPAVPPKPMQRPGQYYQQPSNGRWQPADRSYY